MADTTQTHYVARLVVERVDKVTRNAHTTQQSSDREVIEVANFTVKADELETLKGRIQNHVGLVDE